jgi:hypothetical protein
MTVETIARPKAAIPVQAIVTFLFIALRLSIRYLFGSGI